MIGSAIQSTPRSQGAQGVPRAVGERTPLGSTAAGQVGLGHCLMVGTKVLQPVLQSRRFFPEAGAEALGVRVFPVAAGQPRLPPSIGNWAGEVLLGQAAQNTCLPGRTNSQPLSFLHATPMPVYAHDPQRGQQICQGLKDIDGFAWELSQCLFTLGSP